MSGPEVLVPVIMFAGGFAMIFGIVYLRTRQNLAMIEKGMNPRESVSQPAPYKNLKFGLLLIGAGAGLLAAYLLDLYVIPHEYFTEGSGLDTHRFRRDENPAIYFALIAIGGGLGLLGSYKMEKKWWEENRRSGIENR